MADSSIVQGQVFDFVVVATNQFGSVVPISDASVSLSDPSLGTVGVDGDGNNGQFTSTNGAGVEGLVPSAAGVTGDTYSVEITVDQTVANVHIQALSTRVSNVKIVRRGAPKR